MCKGSPLHEANDLLETMDIDDNPCRDHGTHESSGRSSEREEQQLHGSRVRSAGDGELQVRRPEEHPQEHGRHSPRESHDASEGCGELWPHASDNGNQRTPLVFAEKRCTGMDDTGITSMSCGRGTERVVHCEYHSAMSRDESPTPGPGASFPPREQPSVKGKEWAADERPTQSAGRHSGEPEFM